MNAREDDLDHAPGVTRLSRGRRLRRAAGLTLAIGMAATLAVSCSDDGDGDDKAPDYRKPDTSVTGAAAHHEFELVESIVLPDAGAIHGLEETMDGQVIAAVAPERGDMRVIKFNPHDGAIEELASAPATENYAGKAGHMPQIAKGFGITQFHPTPDSGDPTRQRSTAAIALNVGGLDAGQIIDGQYEPEDFSWVPYDNGVGVGLCAMPSNEKLSIGAEGIPMEERGQKAGTGFVYRSAGDGQLSTVMLEDLVDHRSPTNVRIVVDDDRTKVREEFPGSAADMVVDPEKVGDSSGDYDFKKMLEGKPDYDLDLRGVTLADTALVGGLGELDCLSSQQVAKFAEGGIADEDPEGTRVMAVIDSDLNEAFAEGLVAGGMERDLNLAEFTAPVDMVMIEPSTGVVTDTFSVTGLRENAQVSSIAAFVDDPTQMWVTIEGDDHLHRVQLKKG